MNLTIDNRKIKISEPITLLDAAKQNGIYIPNLCAHPELTPYGGCRMCVVEIEGKRGYPTACTTMIEEGMIVRTDTKTLQEIRREMIQLILSEHPSACLLCTDVEGCTGYQETIRKVGVTTGCRWCPKDKDCELQKIVETLCIDELTLPGLYRNLELEKYDPFFDRDYNLCIYCGRCVRICNEHRKSSVLSLKQRGKLTTIGPAFGQSHIDADCEFCGACVSVCPTGAMSEKSRKWWGVPEKYQDSVCPLCSLNCDIQILTTKDKIVGTLPPGNPHEAGGELCVKGRFCLSELVNRTDRILEPQYRYREGCGFVSWDFAIEKAGEMINGVLPNRSAVFISPSLTLEEYSAANIFAAKVLKTKEITSSCLDENLINYSVMSQQWVNIDEIENADAIFSFFLNGNYNFAPLTLAVKNSASNGIPYYQIGWHKDTTTRFATKHITPPPGKEGKFFEQILNNIKEGKGGSADAREIAEQLKGTKKSIIIIGPGILSFGEFKNILNNLSEIAKQTKSKIIMPNGYGNLHGMLSVLKTNSYTDVNRKIETGKIDLVYIIGDRPNINRSKVKSVIYQNAFPVPAGLEPNVIFPAAVWGETGGAFVNSEGVIKKFKPASEPHGYAYPNIEILTKLTKAAGMSGIKFTKTDIAKNILSKMKINKPVVKVKLQVNGKVGAINNDFPFILTQEKAAHVYNGLNLSEGIAGLSDLIKPNHLILNPVDARKLEFKNGDAVIVSSRKNKKTFCVAIKKNITPGCINLTTSNGNIEFESNPCPVNLRRDNV